jgi:hypothetical protein
VTATPKQDGAMSNHTFGTKEQYIGYYIDSGGGKLEITDSNLTNVTPGTTIAYRLETNLLKQYTNNE